MPLHAFRPGRSPGVLLIGLLAAAFLNQAQAQPKAQPSGPAASAPAARPDPLDAQARVPAAVHSSALAGYRRLGDDRRVDWKEANETVNRIGGWRAYAREAQQPDPAASAPAGSPRPAPAASAAPAHGGHGKP